MKTTASLISALAVLAVSSAMAQITYPGTGDALGNSPADGAGFNSVVVNNDASTISFTINSTQAQASYIFYAIELQIIGQAGSGYTGFADPFGPAVGISSGENALIDTFGTGATPFTYSGSRVAGSAVSYAAGGTGTTSATISGAVKQPWFECRQPVLLRRCVKLHFCPKRWSTSSLWCIG